jgi:hypothetical protein
MRTKLEKKITYHRLGLNDEIKNMSKFYKKNQEQNLEIK